MSNEEAKAAFQMRLCVTEGELDMSTWREDALKGAALGALIFLGVALLLGMAAWLIR